MAVFVGSVHVQPESERKRETERERKEEEMKWGMEEGKRNRKPGLGGK